MALTCHFPAWSNGAVSATLNCLSRTQLRVLSIAVAERIAAVIRGWRAEREGFSSGGRSKATSTSAKPGTCQARLPP
jgi:hypothetical protein